MTAKANRTSLSKSINLAQRVFDGMKIYIPEENGSDKVTQPASPLININSATVKELDVLPGIGPVTADKIIAGRPYQNISELVSRKVVNSATFEKIKEKISVN